nr:GntR family transcriptional regulator [uncultured Cohaesibacter sp.]
MVEKETLAQQAYNAIKQKILSQQYQPETVLTERGLAAELGISRTPLRSAISRIEKEGVVYRLDNGALLVRRVSIEQLLEIVQIRRILEGAAASRAAENGMTQALAASRKVMESCLDIDNNMAFDDFWLLDDAFHNAVIDAAHLPILGGMIQKFRVTARRCTITRVHDKFDAQARDHLTVISAIEAGDGEAARGAMEHHFDNVRTRFLDWLAQA